MRSVRDRAKAVVEKSTEALSASAVESRRIADTNSRIESELRVQLLALQNNRNIASFENVPKLSKKNWKFEIWLWIRIKFWNKQKISWRDEETRETNWLENEPFEQEKLRIAFDERHGGAETRRTS